MITKAMEYTWRSSLAAAQWLAHRTLMMAVWLVVAPWVVRTGIVWLFRYQDAWTSAYRDALMSWLLQSVPYKHTVVQLSGLTAYCVGALGLPHILSILMVAIYTRYAIDASLHRVVGG